MKNTVKKLKNWRLQNQPVRNPDRLNLTALLCLVFLLALIVFIFAAPIDPTAAQRVDLHARNRPPSFSNLQPLTSNLCLLGTDPLGRSVLPLLVLGARNSLTIAFSVAIFSSIIGIIVGLFAGFYGGWFDNLTMRVLDFFTMLPTFMVVVMLLRVLGFGLFSVAAVFIAFGWVGMARQVRMVMLSQRALEYVAASKTLGTPNILIIFREILPNVSSFIIVNFILVTASTIGIETSLTMLGFGLPLTTPSLGHLIAWAMDPLSMQNRPWQWLPAAVLMLVLVLCINYLGQVLRKNSP